MCKTNVVEMARELAQRAHAGQVDKSGHNYLEHVGWVASFCVSEQAQAVAWLHDVVEDTSFTTEDLLASGFSSQIVHAVWLLTKDSSLYYDQYLRRLRANPLAREVKIADLLHNSQLTRLGEQAGSELSLARQEKYRAALAFLLHGDTRVWETASAGTSVSDEAADLDKTDSELMHALETDEFLGRYCRLAGERYLQIKMSASR